MLVRIYSIKFKMESKSHNHEPLVSTIREALAHVYRNDPNVQEKVTKLIAELEDLGVEGMYQLLELSAENFKQIGIRPLQSGNLIKLVKISK